MSTTSNISNPVLACNYKSTGEPTAYTTLMYKGDDLVCIYGGETVEQMTAEIVADDVYINVRVMDLDDLAAECTQFHIKTLDVGAVKVVDADEFTNQFECLPPLKWDKIDGAEIFCTGEPIVADLYNFYIRFKDQYFRIVNSVIGCNLKDMVDSCSSYKATVAAGA